MGVAVFNILGAPIRSNAAKATLTHFKFRGRGDKRSSGDAGADKSSE